MREFLYVTAMILSTIAISLGVVFLVDTIKVAVGMFVNARRRWMNPIKLFQDWPL